MNALPNWYVPTTKRAPLRVYLFPIATDEENNEKVIAHGNGNGSGNGNVSAKHAASTIGADDAHLKKSSNPSRNIADSNHLTAQTKYAPLRKLILNAISSAHFTVQNIIIQPLPDCIQAGNLLLYEFMQISVPVSHHIMPNASASLVTQVILRIFMHADVAQHVCVIGELDYCHAVADALSSIDIQYHAEYNSFMRSVSFSEWEEKTLNERPTSKWKKSNKNVSIVPSNFPYGCIAEIRLHFSIIHDIWPDLSKLYHHFLSEAEKVPIVEDHPAMASQASRSRWAAVIPPSTFHLVSNLHDPRLLPWPGLSVLPTIEALHGKFVMSARHSHTITDVKVHTFRELFFLPIELLGGDESDRPDAEYVANALLRFDETPTENVFYSNPTKCTPEDETSEKYSIVSKQHEMDEWAQNSRKFAKLIAEKIQNRMCTTRYATDRSVYFSDNQAGRLTSQFLSEEMGWECPPIPYTTHNASRTYDRIESEPPGQVVIIIGRLSTLSPLSAFFFNGGRSSQFRTPVSEIRKLFEFHSYLHLQYCSPIADDAMKSHHTRIVNNEYILQRPFDVVDFQGLSG